MRRVLALTLPVLLGACATAIPQTGAPTRPGSTPPSSVRVPPTDPAAPVSGFRAPTVMRLAGLEDVIGRDANALVRQFGNPRLDVLEGDARKLQYAGQACVLDIYLYPLSPGATPSATHVEARRASDGVDVDRAACVRALKR